MQKPAGASPRFEITLPAAMNSDPITGRLFLMISHRNEPEVRLQSTWLSSPEIVAVDVTKLRPGQSVVIDERHLGTPLSSLRDLPPGDYYVQAVLNVYTEFRRADGHVVWAHMDQWEGQHFNKSPGNPCSPVKKLHIGAVRDEPIQLCLSEVIPPLPALKDTQWVKHVKIQSDLLTRFWGCPIYLGAIVLLPLDYAANPDTRYPVIYFQRGHFNLAPPFDFRTDDPPESARDARERQSAGYETGYEFYRAWSSDNFPRMIAVSFLDPTPLADWSGGVNSANNGPYGDAITRELIPFIEQQFRIHPEPYARVLTGKASGGRQALALQLKHPKLFGGAWIFQPWPFTFQCYSALNIYANDDVFEVRGDDMPSWARPVSEWLPTPRYIARLPDGTPFATFKQLSQHDAVMAGMAAGDPIGADDAILGPVGANGLPRPLWDRLTGKMDREVANYWRDHGDLVLYARNNWPTIGRHLVGKLHFHVGEMDHFYRNHGVHLFEDFLETTQNPYYGGTFEYGTLKGDWQPMTNAALVRIMAKHIVENTPKDTAWTWINE